MRNGSKRFQPINPEEMGKVAGTSALPTLQASTPGVNSSSQGVFWHQLNRVSLPADFLSETNSAKVLCLTDTISLINEANGPKPLFHFGPPLRITLWVTLVFHSLTDVPFFYSSIIRRRKRRRRRQGGDEEEEEDEEEESRKKRKRRRGRRRERRGRRGGGKAGGGEEEEQQEERRRKKKKRRKKMRRRGRRRGRAGGRAGARGGEEEEEEEEMRRRKSRRRGGRRRAGGGGGEEEEEEEQEEEWGLKRLHKKTLKEQVWCGGGREREREPFKGGLVRVKSQQADSFSPLFPPLLHPELTPLLCHTEMSSIL
ncbi:DEAD-box ATP-dependent RNA helicase 42, partial [Ophiophagus hannah]